MALLDDVKSELAAIVTNCLAAKRRSDRYDSFGGGLRLVQRQIIVQAQFDSLKAPSGFRTPSGICMGMRRS